MTEEKELLLKDLCARLPYGIIIYRISDNSTHKFIHSDIAENIDQFSNFLEYSGIDDIKPYLRPMSSMTEEERGVYNRFKYIKRHEWDGHSTYTEYVEVDEISNYFDWLNEHHFDHHGLIERGLALEAPKGMYNN